MDKLYALKKDLVLSEELLKKNAQKAENKYLRQEILKKRRALSSDEIQEASQDILPKLLAHPFMQKFSIQRKDIQRNVEKDAQIKDTQTKIIASYCSLNGELDTSLINDTLRLQGFHLALPKVMQQDLGIMEFFDCKKTALIKGAYGIMEPDLNKSTKLDPKTLSLMLIPLVGFDDCGNRLGMGGGFYDRYLKRLSPQCLLIGLAYDFQQIAHINAQEHDMPLDEIITPKQHLVFRSKLF